MDSSSRSSSQTLAAACSVSQHRLSSKRINSNAAQLDGARQVVDGNLKGASERTGARMQPAHQSAGSGTSRGQARPTRFSEREFPPRLGVLHSSMGQSSRDIFEGGQGETDRAARSGAEGARAASQSKNKGPAGAKAGRRGKAAGLTPGQPGSDLASSCSWEILGETQKQDQFSISEESNDDEQSTFANSEGELQLIVEPTDSNESIFDFD